LIGFGYLFGIDPLIWTFFVGWLSLWGVGVIGQILGNRLISQKSSLSPWIGITLILEWHLVWAAGSGMESLLAALVNLFIFLLLTLHSKPWVIIGLLLGGSAWVRPDGLMMLAPALQIMFSLIYSKQLRIVNFLRIFGGFCLGFVPYLLFNNLLAGSLWPNTFFAKQAEYSIELQTSLLSRLGEQFALPLVGVGVLLLPGFFWTVYRGITEGKIIYLSAILWVVGFLVVYALRLPVTYQHGRYAIPAMPVYFVLGLVGSLTAANKISSNLWGRVIKKSWQFSYVLILGAFYILGMKAFDKDVAFIQSEMVKVSAWVRDNTDQDAVIAAHDIGALGYFSGREIIDLAGLVTPDVIDFIRDESRLASYIDSRGAEYLVSFPGWYPQLTSMAEMIYSTQSPVSIRLGAENMQVYCWRICKGH
jgi:hypothetical protein